MDSNPTPVTATPGSIAVVIPTRNRRRLVLECLDSIVTQTHLPDSIIVVDNGSTDGTDEALAEYTDRLPDDVRSRIAIVDEPRQGASRARNTGLRHVGCEYVMFFDSDDLMRREHMERVVDGLQRNSRPDILCWSSALMDPDGWEDILRARDGDPMAMHLFHCQLATQRYCVRTSLLRSLGGWDESLGPLDDLELGVRLLLSEPHPRIAILGGLPQVEVYRTSDSLSSRTDLMPPALDAICRRLNATGSHRLMRWGRALRVIAAARMRADGHRDLSRLQLAEAERGASERDKMILAAIWASTRLTGRGGAWLAQTLMRDKRPQRTGSFIQRLRR